MFKSLFCLDGRRLQVLFCLLFYSGLSFGQMKIHGKVISSDEQSPIIGATVKIKNTANGTITNSMGEFVISADGSDSLMVSYVGYRDKTVPVNSTGEMTVVLEATSQSLSQLVVVGYGVQKKKDLTGAIAIVDVKSMKAQPAASAIEAMQGKAAGVNIVNSGAPGTTPQIRIRGYSTINNNDPLYIIDGVPYQGKLSWLNQNDIESMQILKGASAASIYGSRANNGVVIITTKKGKEGTPLNVTLDAYFGVSQPIKSTFPHFLTPMQFAQYQFQSYRNAGLDPADYLGIMYGDGEEPVLPDYLIAGSAVGRNVTTEDADPAKYSHDPNNFYQITKANKTGTDWMRAITRSAPVQNYQIGATGGGKNSTYAFSAGYLNQLGIVKYTNFKRYSVRMNSQFNALDNHFRFGENVLFTRAEAVGYATNGNTPGGGNYENSPVDQVYKMQVIIPVYDIGGNFAGAQGNDLGDGKTPLGMLYRSKDNFTHENRLFGNLFGEIDILNGLTFRTSFGVDLNNYNSQNITYPNLEEPTGSPANGYSASQGYGMQWTWTNTVNYKHVFQGDHTINLLLGTEANYSSYRDLSGSRSGYFLLGDQDYYYLNSGSSNITNAESGNISTLSSLFGRLDYSFKSKYLLSATVRRDGSSNFGAANLYGVFPSFSAAWRISNESFMSSVSWLNDLKIRAGYGETGNQNIPANNAYDLYQSLNSTSYYPMNGTNALVSGVSQNQVGNPALKWEVLKSTNLGVDFTLLESAIDGSIDLYNRTTSGMLFPVPLPSHISGMANSPYINAGSMRNKGIEIVLNYHYGVNNNNPFKFNLGLNFAHNVNKLVRLAPGIENAPFGNFRSLTTTIFQVGQPYGEFYGYRQAGIFQNQQEVAESTQPGARVGGIKFADANGDGKFSADDRTTLGSPLPKFTYGINTDFSYKNFDLSCFFYGSQGNKIYNVTRYFTDFQVFPSPASTRLLNVWSPDNTSSKIPAPSALASAIEYQSSSYYIEDGSYFRLKNLQLGYTFKGLSLGEKVGISNMRVYASMTNVFTITKYSGMDPEVTQANQTFNLPGIDFGIYPVPQQFLIGLNASF